MFFLNPAVLIGLIAASIPVLIHLLNLRKLKKIEFSTLSFLKELQKNKIRKIRMKQWLLLALRVLIILCIVFAFARPALKGVSIGGAAGTAKTTAVFILDNTFSMSVIGSRGSYFSQAKETIKQLVDEMQEGDEAALILISERDPENISATSNLADFKKNVADAEISYASGLIHNAVAKSTAIISTSKNFNKEIYIFSDFQANRIAEGQINSDFSEVLNENVKLYGFNYSGKDVYNLAVTDFKLQTRIFEKTKPVLFDITVSNFSSWDVNDVVLSLFINNERSGQKSIDIPSGGNVTVSMEANLKSTGLVEFFCEIEDDEILQDNRRYLSINIPSEIPVLVLYDNENDIKYISLALNAAGINNPLKISAADISRLQSLNLSSYKAVILAAGSSKINGIEKIKTFINNGGGAAIFPSSASTNEGFNSVTSFLTSAPVNGISGKKDESMVASRFGNIEFEHPVFKDIFLKEKQKIESPDFYYFYKISGKGRNIISFSDGTSFMSEYSSGKGKIILFSSLPFPGWNNLPLKGIFPPLIYKTILYLSFPLDEEEDLIAGDPSFIDLRGKSVSRLKITRPDGTSGIITTADENFINYGNTGIAGIYNAADDDEIFYKFDVNTDPSESVTKYDQDSDFKEYLRNINFRGEFININPGEDPSGEILKARFGSELWKFFAVLTLLLALAEMTIARSLKKDISETKKGN